MAVDCDGKQVKPGAFVCWKGNMEQSGRVIRITGGMLQIAYRDDETDEPKTANIAANRCWQE